MSCLVLLVCIFQVVFPFRVLHWWDLSLAFLILAYRSNTSIIKIPVSRSKNTRAADFKVELGIWISCTTTAEEATECAVGGCLDGLLCSRGRGYVHGSDHRALGEREEACNLTSTSKTSRTWPTAKSTFGSAGFEPPNGGGVIINSATPASQLFGKCVGTRAHNQTPSHLFASEHTWRRRHGDSRLRARAGSVRAGEVVWSMAERDVCSRTGCTRRAEPPTSLPPHDANVKSFSARSRLALVCWRRGWSVHELGRLWIILLYLSVTVRRRWLHEVLEKLLTMQE